MYNNKISNDQKIVDKKSKKHWYNRLLHWLYITLELQFFLTCISLPIIVWWGLPISWWSWISTPLFAPIFSLFLLISSLIFFSQLFFIPNDYLIILLEHITRLWVWLLTCSLPCTTMLFARPHFLFLILIPIYAFLILHGRIFYKIWIRIILLACLLIISTTCLYFFTQYHPKKLINIRCHDDQLYGLWTEEGLIIIDNGIWGSKRFSPLWIEYEFLATLVDATGADKIFCWISLSYNQRTIEGLAQLSMQLPINKIILPHLVLDNQTITDAYLIIQKHCQTIIIWNGEKENFMFDSKININRLKQMLFYHQTSYHLLCVDLMIDTTTITIKPRKAYKRHKKEK